MQSKLWLVVHKMALLGFSELATSPISIGPDERQVLMTIDIQHIVFKLLRSGIILGKL